MPDFKFIEPSAAAIKELQTALNDVDCRAQDDGEKIRAAVYSILLALREPDSAQMRLHIKTLCDLIEYWMFGLMDTANGRAEDFGAHYINEIERAEASLIYAAASGEKTNG